LCLGSSLPNPDLYIGAYQSTRPNGYGYPFVWGTYAF
jgi:hypothetical protein